MTAIDASAAGLIAPDVLPRPDTVAIAALSIGGVSHSYGPRRALIDINFSVAQNLLYHAALHGIASGETTIARRRSTSEAPGRGPARARMS